MAPNVRLEVVRRLLDHLGRHPEGGAHKGDALLHRLSQLQIKTILKTKN